MDKQEIMDSINWEAAMAAERTAYGHQDVMNNIFEGKAEIIASHIEDDYQGNLAFAYRFPDDTICLITDYFGSCGGCDAWEECSDKEARNLITSMVSSSRIFPTLAEAISYCENVKGDAFQYSHEVTFNLIGPLKEVGAVTEIKARNYGKTLYIHEFKQQLAQRDAEIDRLTQSLANSQHMVQHLESEILKKLPTFGDKVLLRRALVEQLIPYFQKEYRFIESMADRAKCYQCNKNKRNAESGMVGFATCDREHVIPKDLIELKEQVDKLELALKGGK